MYVLPEPEATSFTKAGITGKIFSSTHLTNDVEFVYITTETGHETRIIEHESTFTYYILDGHGHFEIDGLVEVCNPGNLVVIPKGTDFTYKGKLRMLLIVNPPWREEQEETVTDGI